MGMIASFFAVLLRRLYDIIWTSAILQALNREHLCKTVFSYSTVLTGADGFREYGGQMECF